MSHLLKLICVIVLSCLFSVQTGSTQEVAAPVAPETTSTSEVVAAPVAPETPPTSEVVAAPVAPETPPTSEVVVAPVAPETPPTSEVIVAPISPEMEAAKKMIDPEKGYSKLAHPSVAARIGLSDAQRAEVQRLLILRSQELAKFPESEWTNVIQQSEAKLAAVLTPAQQTLWPKIFESRLIRVNFKLQRWSDVLQWFAEQAGLQLVMDSPPPGTFNYADQREYTPSEAIDLLNSVLQTKGYTLVRNDKMLMLFDLKRARIPVQFLPKLKPEDLPDRGKFEYTTVIFPLERRIRADVIQTIDPFKGPYCQVVPMPGNSLMITDTASTLQVLQKVIESVNNPPAPAQPAAGPPPPTPTVWKTYKIEKNDPTKIATIFKEFAPSAKLLRIGNSNEIHILLPEAEQVQLDAILTMLEADSGVEGSASTLVGYSIASYLSPTPQNLWRLSRRGASGPGGQIGASGPGGPIGAAVPGGGNGITPNSFEAGGFPGAEIIALLRQSFPNAIISERPVGDKVVVFASKGEHSKISAFFESLNQMPKSDLEGVCKLYRFKDSNRKLDADSLRSFQAIAPQAVLSLDSHRGQILVVAIDKDHARLAEALVELEAADIAENDKQVVSYQLPAQLATRFSGMLQQLVTKNEIADVLDLKDSRRGRVTIWATPTQHEKIRKLIEELTGTSQDGADSSETATLKPILKVYPLERGYAYTAQQVLTSLLPDAEYSYDYRTNSVIVVATPELQEMIAKAIEELDKGINEDIAFFPIKMATFDPAILQQIARIAPRTIVVQRRRSQQLVATGPKIELDKIKALLHVVEDVAMSNEMVVHSLRTVAPSTVVAVLADIFPEVQVTINAANNQLVLHLDKILKEPVIKLIEEMDGNLEFVSVTKIPSPELMTSLQTMAPQARILFDRDNAQIMLQGSSVDIDNIKKRIIESEKATPLRDHIYVHTFRFAYPYYAASVLNAVYPEVKVAGYPSQNQLAMRLPPSLEQDVISLLEQLDGDIDFIPLKKEVSAEIKASFAQLAPRANVFYDARRSQIMVYGPKPDVETVRKIVTATETAAPLDEEIYVHTFKSAQPVQVAAVIREMYPDIKIGTMPAANQLTLRLPPEMKEKVIPILEEMDGDIVFHPLQKELSVEVLNAFPRIAPNANVVIDKQNGLAMIFGSKPDIERIQKIITTSESATPMNEEVYVHTFRQVYPYYVVAILNAVYPEVKVAGYPSQNQLAVRLLGTKKEDVIKLFEQMDGDIAFIPLKKELPPEIVASFSRVAPLAAIVHDKKNAQIMVYGPKPDVETVRKIVTATETAAPLDEEIYVHTFKSA
ncbi:MAG: secretin N-terminal domain-containing protein, partial [Thermoguttaceae bacterium]